MAAPPPTAVHLTASPWLRKLPGPEGERFVVAFRHGSLEVELYAPRGCDDRTARRRDEVYVVISGHGEFTCGDRQTLFSAGDFLFVPAGMDHRFDHLSDDFATWVIFHGPDGGEAQSIPPS